MTNEEILEGQLLCCKYLGWTIDVEHDIVIEENTCLPLNNGYCNLKDLQFNSNWEWIMLCIEKIAKENNICLGDTLYFLKKELQFFNINSKQDFFKAIINYIKFKEEKVTDTQRLDWLDEGDNIAHTYYQFSGVETLREFIDKQIENEN